MGDVFRVGFVTGATPDKWARTWRERRRDPLELVPVEESEQEAGVRDGSLDMCPVRLPIDRDGLHCIPLYDEVPVVVVPRTTWSTAADQVTLADLSDEQLVLPHASGWTRPCPSWTSRRCRCRTRWRSSRPRWAYCSCPVRGPAPPSQGRQSAAGQRPAEHEGRAGLAGRQRGRAGAVVHRIVRGRTDRGSRTGPELRTAGMG